MKLYRNIIILAVIIALLAGGVFFVWKFNPQEETPEPDQSSVSETITVFEAEPSAISKIEIKTEKEHYTVTKNGDNLALSESAGLDIDESKLQSLIYSCSTISASKVMSEEKDDAAKFGFSENSDSVIVTLSDGSSKTVLIGSLTLDEKSGYIKLSDSDKIYLKSSYGISNLAPEYKSFINKNFVTVDTSDLSELSYVYISKTGNTPVKIEKTDVGDNKKMWKVTTPVYADLNGQVLADNVLTPFSELTVSEVVEARMSRASAYGFDAPYAEFSIDYQGTVTELIFGDKYEKYRFVKVKNFDSVFIVKDAALSFLDVPYQNLMSQLIHVEYISEISKVEISTKDEKIVMDISEGEYKINGKNFEKKAFSKAYQAVIGISLDSVDLSPVPSNAPECTIKYTKNTVLVSFIPIDERNYRVTVDGKGNSVTAKKNFNEAIEFVLNTLKKAQ